jgi:tetratricopeptide (TPR) repeat protein
MPYDLFVSYSRRDNQQGRVSELIARIKEDYSRSTRQDLRCFFDLSDIHAMDDWRNRILTGLRESDLLLLVLSPAYLDSPHCDWEVVEFLKYEHSRAVQGQGVAQVYFVTVPGLDEPAFEAQATSWLARVRQRNHVDLRPWREEGANSLARADVHERLADLERSLEDRLSRLRRVLDAPGNLPAHNPRFVGREVEMERLHKAAGLGQFGMLTAVQGVGGMGKTALAIQYAYAYADFYPGGRWMIGCAGHTRLAVALRTLDSALGIQFSDEEKLDDVRAATRVLTELQRRADRGAAARAGEPHPPSAHALLILDNIDDPALLQPPQTDLLSGRRWLHVIATTRLAPEQFGLDEERHCHLAVDELPEEDALRLIESCQPQQRFASEEERAAAIEIVRMLGGFTLAVEVVAVHLKERHGSRTCTALLARLRRDGVDGIARETTSAVNHEQRLLSATLVPTIESLDEVEKRTLVTAALLPPDSVPLPWIRAVVAQTHPDIARDAEPGYDDPWLVAVNHLVGLRLLQVLEWDDDARTPRVCRMHRLVQEVARRQAESDVPATEAALMGVVMERARALQEGWLEWSNRWEIRPLAVFAALALDRDAAFSDWLADCAARCLGSVGDHAGAEPLYRRALEASERALGPEHPSTLSSVHNLAFLLDRTGDYAGAEPLYRRALAGSERVLGPEHPLTLTSVNNLAGLLQSTGDYAGAARLYRRALEARERVLGPEHCDTLTSVSDLALLLARTGDYAGAESLSRRALAARERVLGPEHPDTLTSVSNLAVLLARTGNYTGAEPLYRRALEASQRVLGPEHPSTLSNVHNLASLLFNTGNYAGAEPLCRRALAASERVLGPEHPDTLTSVNDLAVLLQSTGDYAGAAPLYRRAVEARERVLGPEHPRTLTSVSDLAMLLVRTGDYAGAESLSRRALAVRERVLGPEHPDTLASVQRLADVLGQTGRADEARPLRLRRLEALSRKRDATPLELRTAALDAYQIADYRLAATLLARVLSAGFEIPGTCCHLARVALLTDDVGTADATLAQAWKQRAGAPPYVAPRILWLKLANALASGAAEPSAVVEATLTHLLGRMKTALQAPGAHTVWAMDPVLDHLKPRLPGDAHALLAALVAALSDRANVAALDAFPAWREAEPLALD